MADHLRWGRANKVEVDVKVMSPMLRRIQYNPTQFQRYSRFYKKLKSQNVFIALMIGSAVAIFLPIRWTGPVEKICQAWLAPAGSYTLLAAQRITGRGETLDDSSKLTPTRKDQMLAVLNLKLTELERENRNLMNLRNAMGPGPSLVPSRVAQARVVGHDSLGLASVEVDRGSLSGVKEGLPVLATIPLDILQNENLDPKLAISAGSLVGLIAYDPGPYTARVELFTSSKMNMLAYVLRYVNDKSQIVARVYIQGTPKGDLMVTKLPVPAQRVKVGDLVIPAEPEKFNLPTPVVLGKVVKVDINTDNRLTEDLTICPILQKKDLSKLYILIP